MTRLTVVAACLAVTTLLQGCSLAIMESTKYERRTLTSFGVGTAREAVEKDLGKPVESGRAWNDDLWAVYQQRIYRIHPSGPTAIKSAA